MTISSVHAPITIGDPLRPCSSHAHGLKCRFCHIYRVCPRVPFEYAHYMGTTNVNASSAGCAPIKISQLTLLKSPETNYIHRRAVRPLPHREGDPQMLQCLRLPFHAHGIELSSLTTAKSDPQCVTNEATTRQHVIMHQTLPCHFLEYSRRQRSIRTERRAAYDLLEDNTLTTLRMGLTSECGLETSRELSSPHEFCT